VKVLVQNPLTFKFLCPDGSWSLKIKKARVFSKSSEAIIFCAKSLCKPYQVVLKFEDPESDIILLGLPKKASKPKSNPKRKRMK
jgi:hypothetical protein